MKKDAGWLLEQQLKTYQDRFKSHAPNQMSAKLGYIVRVDAERNVMDIVYLSDSSGSVEVPITFSFRGYRSFAGGMPEPGSLVVFVYITSDDGTAFPVPVAYLPKVDKFGKNYDIVHDLATNTNVRTKSRKLYPGEWAAESRWGAEFQLDKNVTLADSQGNEFVLRSHDNTALLKSVNRVFASAAGLKRHGLVVRNDRLTIKSSPLLQIIQQLNPDASSLLPVEDLEVVNKDGTVTYKQIAGIDPVVLEDGTRLYVVTRANSTGVRQSIDQGGIPWTEDRTELREFSDAVLDVLADFEGYDVDFLLQPTAQALLKQILDWNPEFLIDATDETAYDQLALDIGSIVVPGVDQQDATAAQRKKKLLVYLSQAQKNALFLTQVKGTVIGNDPLNSSYGKVLRRRTFKRWGYSAQDNPTVEAARLNQDSAPKFEVCSTQQEERQLGEASLESYDQSNRSGGILTTAFTVNKEGKYQATLSCSSNADKEGEGISAEIAAEGAAKVFLGKIKSLQPNHGFQQLNPLTGARDNVVDSGQSLYLVTDGSIDIDAKANALGDAWSVSSEGNRKEFTNGNLICRTTGSRFNRTEGDERLEIAGKYQLNVDGDITENVLGQAGKTLNIPNGAYSVLASVISLRATKSFELAFDLDYTQQIKGKLIQQAAEQISTITGKKTEIVGAGSLRSVVGAESVSVTGNFDYAAAQKITVTSTLDSKYTVQAGNFDQEITTTGNFTRSVLVSGNITDQTASGTLKRQVLGTGSIEDNVVTGNIKFSASAGSIEEKALEIKLEATQKALLSGNVETKLKSAVQIILEALQVMIGTQPSGGGQAATTVEVGGPSTLIKFGGATAVEAMVLGTTFTLKFNSHTHMLTPTTMTGPVVPAFAMIPGTDTSTKYSMVGG